MSGRQLRAALAGLLVVLLLAFAGAGTVLASEELTGGPVDAPAEVTPGGDDPGSGDSEPPVMAPPGEVVVPEPPPEFAPPETEPPAEVAPPEVEPPAEVAPPEVEPPVEVEPPALVPPPEDGPPDLQPPPDVEPPAEVEPPGEFEPPAEVAPAQVPEIVIDPVESSGPTGTVVTWAAMVTVDGEPAMDATIEFRGTMEGQPDIVETGVVGSTGEAMHSHTREVAGTETLQVTVTAGEETGSTTATFVWQEPPPDPVVELDLVPLDSNGPVEVPVTWTATVTADGVPVDGAAVYFTAQMEGAESVFFEDFTDADGVVTFEHVRFEPGVEEIFVETFVFEEVLVETSFQWREGLEVALTPLQGSGEHGTDQTWSVSVESGGDPVDGAEVAFLGQMEGESDVTETVITGETGVAEHTHTRDVAGMESIQVTVTYGQETVPVTGSFDWVPVVELDLVPLDSNGPVGVEVIWTATVTADGEPVVGQWLDFYASGEGVETIWYLGETSADGTVQFGHSRSEPGVDDIEVGLFEEDTAVTTTFTWRQPLEVAVSAGGGSAEVGTPVEWTVSVTSGGEGVEGVSVGFLGQMAGEPDVAETVTTDPSGLATHTHTREAAGTEQLTVAATYGEETVTVTDSFVWEEPPPLLEIQLEPEDASGWTGDPVTWTATVTADGEPLEEMSVLFSASMEGAETVYLEDLTDADGTARFEHTRTQPGEDTIWVGAEGLGQEVWAETTFVWEVPVPVVTLTQSSGSGQVGTPLTWTATVTSGDDGVAGVPVRFLGQLPGQPDVDVTISTDASGVATHTHTRSVAGTESLLVAADVDGQVVSATGSFVWEAPPAVQLELTPQDASGPAGETVEWVATVSADGTPQQGESLIFTASTAGADDVTLEGVTGADGTAVFAHTRAAAGVDSITVQGVVLGQEVSATTTFSWQAPPPVLQVEVTPASSSGVIGSAATWTATVTLDGSPVEDVSVEFLGVLPGATDILDPAVLTDEAGEAVHGHTRTVAGTETVTATATLDDLTATTSAQRTWTTPAEPPPPPVPPVIPPPGPPVIPPPSPPPVGPPATTPPAPPPPTAVPPVSVALPIPAQPPAEDPPGVGDLVGIIEDPGTDDGDTVAAPPEVPTTPAPPTTTTPGGPPTNVALGSHSATPGGDLEVSGSGCAPGSTVQILLGGEPLATATADANGDFTARAAVSTMPLGQYAVDVECDGRTGAAQVDLVSTVASSTAPAAAASAAAVLTFFVLLGAGVIKGSVGSAG